MPEGLATGPTLDAEDEKLVTLARSARSRGNGPEGAAVRDDIGRTYAAATVALDSLRLTALQAAVAAALSSGSRRVEAVVVHTAAPQLGPEDRALIAELAPEVALLAAPDGRVTTSR